MVVKNKNSEGLPKGFCVQCDWGDFVVGKREILFSYALLRVQHPRPVT